MLKYMLGKLFLQENYFRNAKPLAVDVCIWITTKSKLKTDNTTEFSVVAILTKQSRGFLKGYRFIILRFALVFECLSLNFEVISLM